MENDPHPGMATLAEIEAWEKRQNPKSAILTRLLNLRVPEFSDIDAAADEITRLETIVRFAREALNDAHTDIGHWCQLAERQFAEMPNASHNPLAPTEAGIKASRDVQAKIGKVIGMIRAEQPSP